MMKNKIFKRTLTIALAFVLLLALMVPLFAITTEDIEGLIKEEEDKSENKPIEFTDVPETHWAYSTIRHLAGAGVVNGVGNDKFNPDGGVKYNEFFTMIERDLNSNYFIFPEIFGYDLKGKPWWWLGMELAKKENFLVGTKVEKAFSNGDWNLSMLEQTVSRNEMAQILYNVYVNNVNGNVHYVWNQRIADPVIPDLQNIPNQYWDAIEWSYEYGLLNGVDPTGKFDGSSLMKRSEAATVIVRLECQAGCKPYPTEDYVVPVGAGYAIDHPTIAPKSGYLTSGKPISEENIAEIVEALKSEYPMDTRWDSTEKYYYESRMGGTAYYLLMTDDNGVMNWRKPVSELDPYILAGDPYYGYEYIHGGCEAFALIFQSAIFGAKPLINPLNIHQDISKVKVGDIIITGNPWVHGCHWQVVYDFIEDPNGNMVPLCVGGNEGNSVGWDSGNITNIVKDWNPTDKEDFIISRWPA